MHPFMLDALARDRMQSRSRAAARMRRPNRFAAVFARVFRRDRRPHRAPRPDPSAGTAPCAGRGGVGAHRRRSPGRRRGRRARRRSDRNRNARSGTRRVSREGRAAVSRADASQRFRRSVVLAAGVVLGVLLVGLRRHDVELRVELDVDLVPVVERHLDLVLALFVTVLGARSRGPRGCTRVRRHVAWSSAGAGDRMIAATVADATRDGHARCPLPATRSLRHHRRSISSWSSLATPPVDVRTSGSVAGDR